jgi:hypothetical protein
MVATPVLPASIGSPMRKRSSAAATATDWHTHLQHAAVPIIDAIRRGRQIAPPYRSELFASLAPQSPPFRIFAATPTHSPEGDCGRLAGPLSVEWPAVRSADTASLLLGPAAAAWAAAPLPARGLLIARTVPVQNPVPRRRLPAPLSNTGDAQACMDRLRPSVGALPARLFRPRQGSGGIQSLYRNVLGAGAPRDDECKNPRPIHSP